MVMASVNRSSLSKSQGSMKYEVISFPGMISHSISTRRPTDTWLNIYKQVITVTSSSMAGMSTPTWCLQ